MEETVQQETQEPKEPNGAVENTETAVGADAGRKPEQGESVEPPANEGPVEVPATPFSPIGNPVQGPSADRGIDMLMDLELPVIVELGRVRMQVKNVLELGPGSVVELNKYSGEPVEIFVNQKKLAEGEVVVIDQNFGVRVTALVGSDERLASLQ